MVGRIVGRGQGFLLAGGEVGRESFDFGIAHDGVCRAGDPGAIAFGFQFVQAGVDLVECLGVDLGHLRRIVGRGCALLLGLGFDFFVFQFWGSP